MNVHSPLGNFWSVAALAEGLRIATPGMLPMAVYGIGFGAVAAQHGVTLVDATLMSTLVFAGASQFVAAEMWAHVGTLAGIATLGVVTAIVNMRFLLMGATLRP